MATPVSDKFEWIKIGENTFKDSPTKSQKTVVTSFAAQAGFSVIVMTRVDVIDRTGTVAHADHNIQVIGNSQIMEVLNNGNVDFYKIQARS